MPEKPLLDISNLSIEAGNSSLVSDVNLVLTEGETLAIVGESGSGKSLTSLAIMGLLSHVLRVSGKINYRGKNLLKLTPREMQKIRGEEIAMIFQEPMTALNPTMKCGRQVSELLQARRSLSGSEAREEVIRLFRKVELPRPGSIYDSYPHEISGGQKQRVMIAMAIACKPKLLIADEPTTALDATVQLGILQLLADLTAEYGMSMIFISHDLAVVRRVAQKIAVMQKGRLMETGPTERVYNHPKDPYTKGLLACRPTPDTYFERLPVVQDYLEGQRPKLKLTGRDQRIELATTRLKEKPLLVVKQVNKLFGGQRSLWSNTEEVHAVKDVDLRVYPGESLGLVGESGSGKTTLGRILCGLERASSGKVFYRGRDITGAGRREWRTLHRKIQIIFQDPFSSLNPRLKVGEIIAEAMLGLSDLDAAKRRKRARGLLAKVGLEPEHYGRYPHEFSGGQRQRIGIARALAVNPEFIVCDESVSALDVSVQAQILNLLNDLKEEFKLTYLFISHDLAVVKYFSDRLVVLKDGAVVESGIAEEIFQKPASEYTRALIESSHG